MAGGLWTRVKNWMLGETVLASDLNAEFNNAIANSIPIKIDDYSETVAQMKSELDPGSQGSEVQATNLAEEIKELRFALRRALGGTYWYDNPNTSLSSLKNLLEAGLVLAPNRIESGRVDANNQPMFLVPNGSATVRIDATPTHFRVYINNSLVEISADLTLSGLTGPTAFACQVNDASLTGTQSTKTQGENGTTITIDTPTGTPPAVGSLQAFKTSTEYFTAVYASSTTLTKASRGRFFNSSDAALSRVAMSDNQVITMVRLAYLFFTYVASTPALESTYNRPIVSYDQPTGPSSGDFWFDTNAGIWKKYNGSSWNDATAIYVGSAVIDGTNTVQACRSADFNNGFSDLHTFSLEKLDNATIQASRYGARLSSYGKNYEWTRDYPIWDMAADLDSGVTEGSSTTYYFYITDLGDTIISDVAPADRRGDLLGYYHPTKPWRCVGSSLNDGSSNLSTPINYESMRDNVIDTNRLVDLAVTTAKLADSSVTRAKLGSANEVVSSSCGSAYSNATTSYTDVTNMSCTITTVGRSVGIEFIPDGSGSDQGSEIDVSRSAATSTIALFKLLRGSTLIAEFTLKISGASGNLNTMIPASVLRHIDIAPAAGTYTYKLQAKIDASSAGTVFMNYTKMVVRELA